MQDDDSSVVNHHFFLAFFQLCHELLGIALIHPTFIFRQLSIPEEFTNEPLIESLTVFGFK